MNFKIDTKSVKVREFLAADGDLPRMLALISRFMVDEQGESIPQEEALEMLYDLDLDASQEVQADFLASLRQILQNGRR